MPTWENIEEVTASPKKVWLTRIKDSTDNWKPLRKCDCHAMNESKEPIVIIEGGRSTADKDKGIITANYHRAPERVLVSRC
jgi:hypothetical protein